MGGPGETSSGDETDKINRSILYSPAVVNIKVGEQAKLFVINRQLICKQSKFFEKAFSGERFIEGQTGECTIKDVNVGIFRIFSAWLYGMCLTYVAEEGQDDDMAELYTTSSSKKSADSSLSSDTLTTASESTEPDTSNFEATDIPTQPETWSWTVMVELYIFADRFDVRRLRADVIDLMAWAKGMPQYRTIRRAFDGVPKSSPLRAFLILESAYLTYFDVDDNHQEPYADLPRDFLVGVMRVNSHRLPVKQCDSCFGEAKKLCAGIKNSIHDDGFDTDIRPIQRDPCIYHEHETEAETKACQKTKASKPKA